MALFVWRRMEVAWLSVAWAGQGEALGLWVPQTAVVGSVPALAVALEVGSEPSAPLAVAWRDGCTPPSTGTQRVTRGVSSWRWLCTWRPEGMTAYLTLLP